MWIVAKVRTKDLNIFKKNLAEKIGSDIKFYQPKIEYYKNFGDKVKRFEKFILENYIFCYHAKFKKSNSINEVKFLRGLEYFLEGYNQNQSLVVLDGVTKKPIIDKNQVNKLKNIIPLFSLYY